MYAYSFVQIHLWLLVRGLESADCLVAWKTDEKEFFFGRCNHLLVLIECSHFNLLEALVFLRSQIREN